MQSLIVSLSTVCCYSPAGVRNRVCGGGAWIYIQSQGRPPCHIALYAYDFKHIEHITLHFSCFYHEDIHLSLQQM